MLIFACGVITGSLVVRTLDNPTRLATTAPQPPASTNSKMAAMPPFTMQRPEFLRRLDHQLDLTPQQHESIAKIIEASHQRSQVLWDTIAPQMSDELKRVREEIRSELTVDQRKRWGELMGKRHKSETLPSIRPAEPEKDAVHTNF